MEIQFIELCKKGDLVGLQQLFQLNPDIDISSNNELSFRSACFNGHLLVCQWLLEVKPDINISANNEWAFRYACERGHLHVCQWLLQVKQDINISANNEWAFRYACEKGHLRVCQWLLQVSKERGQDINISAQKRKFNYKCCYRHLEVAQRLQSLDPYLFVLEYNDSGKYKGFKIREKQEANWERRKYLVWLASNHCPEENRTNLLYKLPFDVSRLIIAFV